MPTDRYRARPGRTSTAALRLVAVAVLAALLAACSSSGGNDGPDALNASQDLPASCRAAAGTTAPPAIAAATAMATEPVAPSSLPEVRDDGTPVAPANAHLRGRVIDGLCRTPIADAGVGFFSGDDRNAPVTNTVTDANGRFDVVLPRDRYRIAFNHAGLNYDFTWYPAGADFAGGQEVALRGDLDLPDLELFHPEDQPVPPYEGDGQRHLVVIGDSLVQESTTSITRKLDLIGPTSVRGIANQRIDQMQPTAERYAAMDPDTVVIALGSNDANQDHPIEQSIDGMAAMLQTMAKARCIVVLDVNTHTLRPEFNEAGDELNRRLADVVRKHPNAHLAPWNKTVDVLLSAGPMDEWFTDGLHLTDRGIEMYARAITQAVGNC